MNVVQTLIVWMKMTATHASAMLDTSEMTVISAAVIIHSLSKE